ncbi:anti-phage ZorAB system protein ZorA [uncultured Fusobacterium sp.]|uniref:anti-phage ZorAB system protein ZorA n=1 Tax=uncultured Fusobacterium sp. TaxID=159267 RepID=UPI0025E5D4B5|nr:anti-phage ZorAB system protein ZorA [uncultured Fusobacterium sp.]
MKNTLKKITPIVIFLIIMGMAIFLSIVSWNLLRNNNKNLILKSVDEQSRIELEKNYLENIGFYELLDNLNKNEIILEKDVEIVKKNKKDTLFLEKLIDREILTILEEKNEWQKDKLKDEYLRFSSSKRKYDIALKSLIEKNIIEIKGNRIKLNNNFNIEKLNGNEIKIIGIVLDGQTNKKELEKSFLNTSVSNQNFESALSKLEEEGYITIQEKKLILPKENINLLEVDFKVKNILILLYQNDVENFSQLDNLYLEKYFLPDYYELLKDKVVKEEIDGTVYRDNLFSENEIFFLGIVSIFSISILIRIGRDYNKIKDLSKLRTILCQVNDYYKLNEKIDEFSEKSIVKREWKNYRDSLYIKEKTIYETIDAEFFFNFDSLYKGEIRYKVFSYIPQLMVGLGMLGTFYGLSSGLSGLELGNVDSIQNSVGELLSGVKTAFYTSLFGLAYSILYTILLNFYMVEIEKIIFEIRKKIGTITKKIVNQNYIEEISKRLEEIKSSNNDMATTLNNQIETMGKNLNENIVNFSNNIGGNFKNELSNVLDKIFNENLVMNLNNSLENISNVFLTNSEKMQEFKSEIVNMIKDLSELKLSYMNVLEETNNLKSEFKITMENLNNGLSDITESINEVSRKYKETTNELEQIIDTLTNSQNNNIDILESNKEVMEVATTLLENSKDMLSAEKVVQELWQSYELTFKDINLKLVTSLETYKNNLEVTGIQLREILKENSDEYNTFIKNQTLDFTNEIKRGLVNLFTDYDQNLSVVINKFNGVLLDFNDKITNFSEVMLETKELIDEHNENLKNNLEIERGEE